MNDPSKKLKTQLPARLEASKGHARTVYGGLVEATLVTSKNQE
jgi:hypothetical protein